MLKKKDQDHTFALKCDPLGGVVNVLSDHKGFFSQISPQDLFQTMDAVSSTQFQNLMSEALMHGVSLRPGISLHMNGQDFVFSMFTMSRGNVNYVMAVQRPQHIFKVYEEFMGIINEQGRLLRKTQQEGAMFGHQKHNDVNRLEECMRLNNELSNMQRELSKKNHELSEAYIKIEALSRTDQLSGLANRRYFMDRLKEALSLCRRQSISASLLMADLDHFKEINDEFGHAAGDEVIRVFAEILKGNCRMEDLAARYGGEEFLVLMPGTPLAKAQASAERIRTFLEKQDILGCGRAVTVSIGVVQYLATESPEEFVLRADKALYKAKNNGRNRIECAPA